jgi:hypothetical protein
MLPAGCHGKGTSNKPRRVYTMKDAPLDVEVPGTCLPLLGQASNLRLSEDERG